MSTRTKLTVGHATLDSSMSRRANVGSCVAWIKFNIASFILVRLIYDYMAKYYACKWIYRAESNTE